MTIRWVCQAPCATLSFFLISAAVTAPKTSWKPPPKEEWQIGPDQSSVTFRNVFTVDECNDIVKHAVDNLHSEDGKLVGSDNDIRRSIVRWLHPADKPLLWVVQRMVSVMSAANKQLWKFRVSDYSGDPESLGYWQIALYPGEKKAPGQYGWHADTSPDDMSRMLSATVQLSSPNDYEGGSLQMGNNHTVGKDQGSMTLFPSYYPHAVRPTLSGSRYSLVAWFPTKQGSRPPRSWFKSMRRHYKALQRHAEAASDQLLHELVSCHQLPWAVAETSGDDAVQDVYVRAVSIYPSSFDCYNYWGVHLGKQGRIEDAIQKLKKGLELQPSHENLQANLKHAISLQQSSDL